MCGLCLYKTDLLTASKDIYMICVSNARTEAVVVNSQETESRVLHNAHSA